MEPILKSIKAVSEEIRMRILMLLIDREACVCELMEVFNMAQSKLSHHLITLRKAGLLQGEKRGKWHYYRAQHNDLSVRNSGVLTLLSRSLADDKLIEKDRRKFGAIKRRKMVENKNKMKVCNGLKVKKGACVK